MDAIAEVSNRKTVRSWVQFEQRTIEDVKATEREGKYVGRDVDFVIITPAYGKDDVHRKVEDWRKDLKQKVQQRRISQEDCDYYLGRYDAWKRGIEAPPDGTPIKGWGVISASQQKLLLSVGILTVESLSQINDEGVKRIGMGAVDLKRKATAWLAQLNDKGPLTVQMASVQKENDNLKIEMNTMRQQIAEMTAMLKQTVTVAQASAPEQVTVADLIEDEPIKPRKR